MQYRTLGKSGIRISPYALGAMMFGAIGNPDHDDSIRIIHRALDAGINVIDTADIYSMGESEEIVGKALRGRRDDVVVATKAFAKMGDDPNHQGNSRRWITRAIEGSLRRLQTDHVDLFQIHQPDPTVDIDETLDVLSDLVRAGKVRAIGTSSMPSSEIVEAQWVADRRGFVRFRSEQPPYSLLNRGIERDVLPTLQRYGMGALVWSPLSGGMLTGRIRKGQPTDLRRADLWKYMRDERRLEAVDRIDSVARNAGLTITHLSMAFAIAHPAVTAAIIGPRTEEQLGDLLAGADVALTDDVLDALDEIVPPGTDLGELDMAYQPPALRDSTERRRRMADRSAA